MRKVTSAQTQPARRYRWRNPSRIRPAGHPGDNASHVLMQMAKHGVPPDFRHLANNNGVKVFHAGGVSDHDARGVRSVYLIENDDDENTSATPPTRSTSTTSDAHGRSLITILRGGDPTLAGEALSQAIFREVAARSEADLPPHASSEEKRLQAFS